MPKETIAEQTQLIRDASETFQEPKNSSKGGCCMEKNYVGGQSL